MPDRANLFYYSESSRFFYVPFAKFLDLSYIKLPDVAAV
jgi:hypothetical protein